MAEDRTSPFEFFNASLEAFSRADLSEAVFRLRGGFFGNLYVAPLLLGEEFSPQKIWSPGAEGEPRLAREYVARYGHLWKGRPDAVAFLGEVWGDSLIRAELRSFINLSKNILNARSESELSDLLRERERFLSPERLKRTQSEVLSRVEKANLYLPPSRPQLALIMLASKDPALSRRFYRDLLEIEPVTRSPLAGGYVEFEFEGVHFAIHGQDRAAPTDPYQIGHPPASFGWGAIFVFRVHDLDRYFQNAAAGRLDVVDSDLSTAGRRYFVVKDPSGYLVEITEEDPKGLEPV